MSEIGLVTSVLISAILGSLIGFCAGLVPGLHMNNIASAFVARAAAVTALFGSLPESGGSERSGLLVCCFLSAAMAAHMFSEAVPSTYVGIPSEDVVSVLPAHRLAKAGMGNLAIQSSARGSIEGVIVAVVLLAPVCVLMSPPIDLYRSLKSVMFVVIAIFCAVLLLSEGFPTLRIRGGREGAWSKVVAGTAVFVLSGLIGVTLLMTDYFACRVPDFPWIKASFVPQSSLLLPMFAGFFGVPSLLLSLDSKRVEPLAMRATFSEVFSLTARDMGIGVLGGLMVGWMPGMTSGSAATICSPRTSEHSRNDDIAGSLRFIWLYSAISSSGAVFALGALFVISRARSGTMEAVKDFLGTRTFEGHWTSEPSLLLSMLLAIAFASFLSFVLLTRCEGLLFRCRHLLCSKRLSLASLAFVVCLSVWLTGVRGALVMVACASLGLVPPLLGVRRIQLMGCLLVPVGALFLGMML